MNHDDLLPASLLFLSLRTKDNKRGCPSYQYLVGRKSLRCASDLLEEIFQYEPSERLPAEQVVNHGWFRM